MVLSLPGPTLVALSRSTYFSSCQPCLSVSSLFFVKWNSFVLTENWLNWLTTGRYSAVRFTKPFRRMNYIVFRNIAYALDQFRSPFFFLQSWFTSSTSFGIFLDNCWRKGIEKSFLGKNVNSLHRLPYTTVNF